jgi:hypothetical protein
MKIDTICGDTSGGTCTPWRYTYVWNNPLAYTDPSGYFSWKGFINGLAQVVGFVAMFVPGLQWVGWVAYGLNVASAAISGGLKAGLLTAFTGLLKLPGGQLAQAAQRVLIAGVSSVIMGGKFGAGLVGGLKSAAIGFVMQNVAGAVRSAQTGGKMKSGNPRKMQEVKANNAGFDSTTAEGRQKIAREAFDLRGDLGIAHNPNDKLDYRDDHYYTITDKATGETVFNGRTGTHYESGEYSDLSRYRVFETGGEYDARTNSVILYRGAVYGERAEGLIAQGNKVVTHHYNLSNIENAIRIVGHESAHGLGYDLNVPASGPHPNADYYGFKAVDMYRSGQRVVNWQRILNKQ